MRTLGIIFSAVLGVAALVGLFIALDLGGLVYQENTAEMRGESDAEQRIESAGSRIEAYERFFDLCASVQAREAAMDAIRANDAMDEEKRSTAIMSNETQRGRLIADYNSDSTKNYTQARFKDSDLPWRLDRGAYDGSNQTRCVAE